MTHNEDDSDCVGWEAGTAASTTKIAKYRTKGGASGVKLQLLSSNWCTSLMCVCLRHPPRTTVIAWIGKLDLRQVPETSRSTGRMVVKVVTEDGKLIAKYQT